MTNPLPTLPLGYTDAAPGHVVSVVTHLEITERPAEIRPAVLPDGVTVDAVRWTDLAAYRDLFRQVGADWLWTSRLLMSDDELRAILQDPLYEAFVIRRHGVDIGLLELDFRQPETCELVFLGVMRGVMRQGIGTAVLRRAAELAYAHPIQRFWLHTCTFDHPSALQLYYGWGFKPFAVQVEVQADPRLNGYLPLLAAPHVPFVLPPGHILPRRR